MLVKGKEKKRRLSGCRWGEAVLWASGFRFFRVGACRSARLFASPLWLLMEQVTQWRWGERGCWSA